MGCYLVQFAFLFDSILRKRLAPTSKQPPPTVEELIEYPDILGLDPLTIAQFINANRRMSLIRLLKRLQIKEDDQRLTFCSTCQAYTAFGNNDAVLRVGDDFGSDWMFLVFSFTSQRSTWDFVGAINNFDKYSAPDCRFVVSDEQQYLLISELGAYGSGLALYQNKVFQLEKTEVRKVFSFLSKGLIGGEPDYQPTLAFDTQFISLEVDKEKLVATIEYTFHWSYFDLALVSKLKTVKLSSPFRRGMNHYDSEDYESWAMRFLDSMTEHDFLKYNLAELHKLATQGTRDQKSWLKYYLNHCEESKAKRQLLAALAN